MSTPRSVHRITVIQTRRPSDTQAVEVVSKKKKKKKKQTAVLRELGRTVRVISKAASAAVDEYTAKHDRSLRKRKDGWFRDFAYNVTLADKKGLKKLRRLYRM